MPKSKSDPRAVHCPHCGAEPGQPCHSPGGDLRRVDHGQRVHLAYALLFPEANFYRAEAERYRMRYPGVQVGEIICTPSRAQALWWSQWGRVMRYDQAQYEREHGKDTSVPVEVDEESVGMKVSELLEQFDKVKVPKRK